MSQIKRKRQNQFFHGDLAHSLIQLAVIEITSTGSVEFSLRELAKKLGVSHTAAYKHFNDKQALLETIALQGFLKLSNHFQQALKVNDKSTAIKPTSKLHHLGKSYIEFALHNPGYYRVMFGIKLNKERNRALHEASLQAFLILLDTIGSRTKENVKKAMLVWSVVHGWVTLRLEGQISGLAEQFKTTENEIEDYLHDSF